MYVIFLVFLFCMKNISLMNFNFNFTFRFDHISFFDGVSGIVSCFFYVMFVLLVCICSLSCCLFSLFVI